MWSRGVALALVLLAASACGGSPGSGAPQDTAVRAVDINGLARGVDPCPDAVEPAEGADEGDRLPKLELPCLGPGASMVDLAEPTGRPTVVNLWATWCGPCREEMPVLQDAYERHAGEILFVGVDTRDQPERAVDFLREVGVTYPQVVDGDGRLLDGMGIRGLPVTIMLDADGIIVGQHIGPLDREGIDDLVGKVEE